MSRARRAAALVLTGLIGLSACTTLKIADIPVQRTDAYRYAGQQGSVRIAVRPFADPTESDRHFGTDLIDNNVLALLIVAENRSTSSSYILAKEQCQLGERRATDQAEAPAGPGGAVGAGVAVAGAALVSGPLLIGGLLTMLKLESNAQMIRHNFYRVELKRQTISPGQTAHGVVYFRLNDDRIKKESTSLVLYVSLQDLKTDAIETVAVPFALRDQ